MNKSGRERKRLSHATYMPWMAIKKKKKKMKTIITERLGEGHMGRYCTDVGGERKKKKPSRIRSIYTVYVTESMVILMNSIIIIV